MKRLVSFSLALLWSAAWAAVHAQTPAGQPRFAVVSIKQNRSGAIEGGLRINPGGQMQWTNTTLESLIGMSHQRYAFDQRETEGGPGWIDTARFDVLVQTGSGTPAVDPDGYPGQLFAMIRALLADRFGVKTHTEMRDRPIFRLVRVRPGAPTGPGLTPVAAGCGQAMKALSGGEQVQARTGRGPDCTFGGPPGQLRGNAVTIDMLSRVLANQVRRHIVNETGIDGSFDVDLTFSPEFMAPSPDGAAGDPPLSPSDAPSIFTAVQEQLGLKLESARGPVEVLVVDDAHMPTAN